MHSYLALLVFLLLPSAFGFQGIANWTQRSSCAGVLVGGYCWYLGASGASCDTTCSTHGGCNSAGTINYAGSLGTNANCGAVLAALGATGGATDVTGNPIGCTFWASFGRYRYTSGATTCAGAVVNNQRACACNN